MSSDGKKINITCDSCGVTHRIDSSKIPQGKTVTRKCKCGHQMTITNSLESTSNQTDTNKKKCPKCNYEVMSDAESCSECGVIFKRYEEAQRKKEEFEVQKTQQKNENNNIENQGDSPSNKDFLSLMKSIPFSFRGIKDAYLSFNIWWKIFFGFMLFIWISQVAGLAITAFSEWTWIYIVAIPLWIAYSWIIYISLPHFCYLYIKEIQENYDKNTVQYKYLAFEGTMQRLDFFLGTLILEGIAFGSVVGGFFLFGILMSIGIAFNAGTIGAYIVIFILSIIIPVLHVFFFMALYSIFIITLKRISDIGRSRWLALLFFVPFVNMVFQIALYFIPSQDATPLPNNRHSKKYKECPECAEVILEKAVKCRFCGYRFKQS